MDKLCPTTPIPALEGLTVGDFWSWAYSDLLSNQNRGVFAEFLVGTALGVVDKPRVEWDGCDLIYRGHKIEVKASGFLQSWQQHTLSPVRFDIALKQAWDAAANTYSNRALRVSDCYVFCLFGETDPARISVLNVEAWSFFILSSRFIDARLGGQKTIGLAPLRQLCEPVHYDRLRAAVDRVLNVM